VDDYKTNPEKIKQSIERLRDVTGVGDEAELRRALDASKFNVDKAVQIILGWKGGATERVVEGAERMPPSPAAVINPATPLRPVVDLTEDKAGDDLRRAIALSLADGSSTSGAATSRPPGVSQEDQDVSKALEASLLESVNSRRTNDGANPNDRKREGQWPVGLKNVGQTCWFSAVIQSFFHLPAFRVLVTSFKPPQREPKSEKERKILDFMLELRKLFSLLLGSQRKYVDPSTAVGILRGYLGGENAYCNNQQDVSEFTHKLLDWLEEAFKIRDKYSHPASKEAEAMEADTEKCDKEKEVTTNEENMEASGAPRSNPMFDLFYGKVKIEGKNQGNEFSREEQFGQWPLQVNSFSDIHESLEASTAHEFIDTCSQPDLQAATTVPRKSGQERWFTKLPPVLFFELSRFQFNQAKGMAEKINNYLDFPDVIYMDRYLEANKTITRSKREEVKALKEQRERLRGQQQAFLEYGSDASQRIPLVNILSRTMQFAQSGSDCLDETGAGGDAEPSNNAMQVDSPCPSPSLTPSSTLVNLNASSKSPLKTLPDGSIQIPIKVEQAEPGTPTPMEVEPAPESVEGKMESTSTSQPDGANYPTPRHVSELELKVLSACLSRWRHEVEEDLASLNAALMDIDTKIREMYEVPSLNQNKYRLHAVMVHEGDVNQGHYWAYVYHPTRKLWLKFNDNTVDETDWVSMKKESAGGRMSTSAYSMIYIDTSRPDLIAVADVLVPGESATREGLQDDLEQYVQEDNKLFASEILDWEELPLKKSEPDLSEGVLIGDDPECQIIETKSDLSNSHAVLAQQMTERTLNQLEASSENKLSLSTLLQELYNNACKRVKEGDHNLESFLHYLIAVSAGTEIVRRAMFEQLLLPSLNTSSELCRQVVSEAREQLSKGEMKEETNRWHKVYHNFRIASFYFTLGVDRYNKNNLEDAVDLFTTSYIVNDRLIEDPIPCKSKELKGISRQGLVKFFHISVDKLNAQLVDEFERGNEPAEVASRVSRTLVPAIHILQSRTYSSPDPGNQDAALLESVRGRWCALLESPMAQEKHEYWSTVFNTVVPDDNSVVIRNPQNLRYPKLSEDLKLAGLFRQIMQTVLKEEN